MKPILFIILLGVVSPIYSQVGIGTTTPDPSSILDISSSTAGLLPPRMTTAERDLIVSPAEGLFIFNTTSDCLNFYDGTRWEQFCGSVPAVLSCGGQSPSGSLIAGASATSFTIDLPYTEGDGSTYPSLAIASTGVLGLTATLATGTLSNGAGTLTFQITGTPTSPGTATFNLSLFRQVCDLDVDVTSTCGSGTGLGLNDLSGATFTIDGNTVTTTTTGTTGMNDTSLGFTRCSVTTGDSFLAPLLGSGGSIVVNFSIPVNNVQLIAANMYPGSNAVITTDTGGTLTITDYVNNCPSDFVISGTSLQGSTNYPNAIVNINGASAYTQITITVTQDNTYYGFCFENTTTP